MYVYIYQFMEPPILFIVSRRNLQAHQCPLVLLTNRIAHSGDLRRSSRSGLFSWASEWCPSLCVSAASRPRFPSPSTLGGRYQRRSGRAWPAWRLKRKQTRETLKWFLPPSTHHLQPLDNLCSCLVLYKPAFAALLQFWFNTLLFCRLTYHFGWTSSWFKCITIYIICICLKLCKILPSKD